MFPVNNEGVVTFSQFIVLPGCKQKVQQITSQLSICSLIHNRNPKLFLWPQTDCVVHCWAQFKPRDIHSSKFTRLSRTASVCSEERFLWCRRSNYWRLTTNFILKVSNTEQQVVWRLYSPLALWLLLTTWNDASVPYWSWALCLMFVCRLLNNPIIAAQLSLSPCDV